MASVLKGINEVSDNVTTVAGAATEQAQTSESISLSAEELYQMFSDEKLQVQSLKDEVNDLYILAGELSEQLKYFKV
jgi:methyl-accepting chemotaxis protein